MIDYKEKYQGSLNLLQSPYDRRNYKFSKLLPMAAFKIPDTYVVADAGFTYDQGNSSMCCASAISYIRYLQEQEQSDIQTPFCPSFIYANRYDDELFEGMYLLSACKKAREGLVLKDEMAYPNTLVGARKEFFQKKDELMEKAYPWRISSFYTCATRKEIQVAIMQTKAVLIGIPVFDSFYTPDENGIIKFVKGQKSDGGHAVCLRGWAMIHGEFYWRVQNSWGADWGNLGDGSAWLPAAYPWMDDAYVLVDPIMETDFISYTRKYYYGEE